MHNRLIYTQAPVWRSCSPELQHLDPRLSDEKALSFWTPYLATMTGAALAVNVYSAHNVNLMSEGFVYLGKRLLTCPDVLPAYLHRFYANEGGMREVLRRQRSDNHVSGSHVAVSSDSHRVYGHWLVDILPRIWLVKHHLRLQDDLRVLLPFDTPKFALDILYEHFGLADRTINYYNPYYERTIVEHAIVPSYLHNSHIFHPGMNLFIDFCRMLSGVGGGSRRRDIFVSRANVKSDLGHRRLANHDALLRAVEARGLEIVYPENLSWIEQVRLFAEARVIMGEAGSGLHNSVFAGSGATVICLRPQNAVQMSLAALRKHRFGMLTPDREWQEDESVHYTVCIETAKQIIDQARALYDGSAAPNDDDTMPRPAPQHVDLKPIRREIAHVAARCAKDRNQKIKSISRGTTATYVPNDAFRSQLFDSRFYLNNNPDVSRSGLDPYLHYVLAGANEGRRPCLAFDPDWYLSRYPDVRQSGLNPLAHYELFGRLEMREALPSRPYQSPRNIRKESSDDVSSAQGAISNMEYTGRHYTDVLADLVIGRSVRTYLEVGVCFGANFSSIACDTAIGIDPAFDIRHNVAAGKRHVHLLRTTSDEALTSPALKSLAPAGLDFVFLDGMHLFEYLLRDFYKSEALCSGNALVAMHDCLPINAEMAERVHNFAARQDARYASWWTGDVWKIIPALKKYRPDLVLKGFGAPPTGLLFATNLDPSSRVLEMNYLKIVQEFGALENTESNIRAALNDLTMLTSDDIATFSHSLHFKL